MNKLLCLFLVSLLLSFNVSAMAIPWVTYCQHQGYTYEYTRETLYDTSESYCVFDDGNKCDAQAFLEGTCGQNYVRDISCRQEGELVISSFEQCCEGLDPVTTWDTVCVKHLTFFEKVWAGLKSLFRTNNRIGLG